MAMERIAEALTATGRLRTMTLQPRQPAAPGVRAFWSPFCAALLLGPTVIEGLRVLKFGQNINYDAPARHQQKQGDSDLGGVMLVPGRSRPLLVAGAVLGSGRGHTGAQRAVDRRMARLSGPRGAGLHGRLPEDQARQVAG